VLQVQHLTAQLSSHELQLQLASEAGADAQAEVAALQASLLQQMATAEAAQAQLAAAAITQQVHALLLPQAASQAAYLGNGTALAAGAGVEPSSVCADLADAVQRQLAASPLPAGDPKVQRIQELRAALAAALADAAQGAETRAQAQHEPNMLMNLTRPDIMHLTAAACLTDDPKVRRLQEAVSALLSAATQLPTTNSAAQDLGPSDGSRAEPGSLAVDPKLQRIQELRAALAEALRERDDLKAQLQAGPVIAHSTLMQAGQQLQEAQQKLVAVQVRISHITSYNHRQLVYLTMVCHDVCLA
jgi:DNA repair exonuclease SbcCD ATPase subunit